jgi:hypothetical protein
VSAASAEAVHPICIGSGRDCVGGSRAVCLGELVRFGLVGCRGTVTPNLFSGSFLVDAEEISRKGLERSTNAVFY